MDIEILALQIADAEAQLAANLARKALNDRTFTAQRNEQQKRLAEMKIALAKLESKSVPVEEVLE